MTDAPRLEVDRDVRRQDEPHRPQPSHGFATEWCLESTLEGDEPSTAGDRPPTAS